MKTNLISFLFCFSIITSTEAQQQLTIAGNAQINISDNSYLVLDNSNTNAIVQIGAGGSIISENENSALKWMTGNNTGIYSIPFMTNSGVEIPLEVEITSAGTGTGLVFSTYETSNDMNSPLPSAVTSMNSAALGGDASLYFVDRFWRIDPSGYSVIPDFSITFGYDDMSNEIGGSNTIVESNLKAQRFNTNVDSWEDQSFGAVNTSINKVENVIINGTQFYEFWSLIDDKFILSIDPHSDLPYTIDVYPNPTKDNAIIQIKGIHPVNLKLYNSVGQEVQANFLISDNDVTLSLEYLATGSYTVLIIDDQDLNYRIRLTKSN